MPIPSSGDEIEAEIIDRIERGVYPPGSRLPSTTEFALEFGVSYATIYRVVRRLREAGDVVGRPGNGVFVSED